MKIAIAAVLFDDKQRIAAQRPRAFARELAAAGHDVTVFTEGDPTNRDSPFVGVKVVRLGDYGPDLWPTTGAQGLIRKVIHGAVISGTVWNVRRLRRAESKHSLSPAQRAAFFNFQRRRASSMLRVDLLLSTYRWLKDARPRIHESFSSQEPFDVVFTTFDPLGRLLKDEGLAREWINDFGDPSTSEAFLPLLNAYLRGYQSRIIRDADHVTAISAGVRKTLLLPPPASSYSDKVTVLPNGFVARPRRKLDDDSRNPQVERLSSAPLRIGYTGQISARQEPEMRRFLQAIVSAQSATGASIEVHYAGRSHELVRSLARETGTGAVLKTQGLIPHERALELQAHMDALLVLSHNNPGAEGILCGKFLEYLGADKPIIAVVGGTLAGSELAEIVDRCQVGICSERAQGPAADALLANTLSEWAEMRSLGQPIPFAPVPEAVQDFDYKNLTGRLLELIQADRTE